MEKDLAVAELFEIYKGLLTKRQNQLMSAYYIYDLSLGEIAEQFEISRQSVFDGLKKCKAALLKYESELKLNKKFTKLIALSESVKEGNFALAKEIENIVGE